VCTLSSTRDCMASLPLSGPAALAPNALASMHRPSAPGRPRAPSHGARATRSKDGPWPSRWGANIAPQWVCIDTSASQGWAPFRVCQTAGTLSWSRRRSR
jgi:hypothetical protein